MEEILKIFINMVLWRKIKKDLILTCCYVCDIGLMIDNKKMNTMSLFCLSQLSENEKSHPYLFKTVNPFPKEKIQRQISIRDYQDPQPVEEENKKYSVF